ncbi:MAG: hypothetical protein GWM90_31255 [Gemmatimonadetes bacterium]|nr:hypothetical protein [Gemmatimonadota bacterium]NIQ59693.1 hypothetical protein [Gemmatimonadota bacterium]NIU79894.1 hypothetical protein [Gammaproteobacteria bacterium]NIX48377.1 hypothetical protein [Gemmatimonadota bacterium]NIY12817.1 hypothetical protein [Gemmatimonadota bacterium]
MSESGRDSGPDRGPGRDAPGPVIGLDGGGTHTRIAVTDVDGRELLRREGPPGLIDPRDPAGTAAILVRLIRETADEAEVPLPASALCAGLAGAGSEPERNAVLDTLTAAGVATRIAVVQDAEIALRGALDGEPGILLAAGTGSIAFGRAEDGRIGRCGGWGHLVGDEGSGYTIAREGLKAALQAADGRAPDTRLLGDLIAHLGLDEPRDIPSWVARTDKAEVAALAPRVARLAEEGDGAALRIVEAAADHLAHHVEALLVRLAPWSRPVPVVFFGGALEDPDLARRVESRLRHSPVETARRRPIADAVTGAVLHALDLATTGSGAG